MTLDMLLKVAGVAGGLVSLAVPPLIKILWNLDKRLTRIETLQETHIKNLERSVSKILTELSSEK